jgi:PAS domain S-box-containing protein
MPAKQEENHLEFLNRQKSAMTNQANRPNQKFSELRDKAMEALSGYQDADPVYYSGDIKQLIVELESNRVKLELQNEELRDSQVKLETARLKYNELYSFAPIGYMTIDSEGYIIEANLKAAHLLNMNRFDLLNQRFSLFVHFDDQDIYYLHQQSLKESNRQQSCLVRLKTGKGSFLYVQLESVPRSSVTGVSGQMLLTMTDITELIQARHEVELLNEELEQRVQQRTLKLERAQSQLLHSEKLSAIGALSASIAHELNNPLQGILNVIKGVGKRAILEPEDAELMEIALNECLRMRTLLKSLQDFNRPSSGIRAPINLHNTLDSVLLLYKKKFATSNIILEKHYCDGVPIFYAVADQIKQVVMNILNNAIDACENGGKISVTTKFDHFYISLCIKDNGVGIDPANKYNIFEPFFSTKPEVKGTGLGLSVSYGIIKKHNGILEVNSTPGKGAAFRIKLPLRETERSK